MANKITSVTLDDESQGLLKAICDATGASASATMRVAIRSLYESSTCNSGFVRIPIIGRIANGKVFIDDSAEREYVGNDVERE